MVRLEAMSEEDFEASVCRAIRRHAADQVRRGVWTEDEADRASRADFAELLPHGRETPSFHFCNLVDERDGSRVGETWYNVRMKGGKTQVWVDWIWIDPPFRRRGHASNVLRHFEAMAVKLGADRVGLHVLSDNEIALALYAKLGYRTTDVRMAKVLHPPA